VDQASNNKVRRVHLSEDPGVRRLASLLTKACALKASAEQTLMRRVVSDSISPCNFSFGVQGQGDNLLPFSVE
jgi:hypothetical protein